MNFFMDAMNLQGLLLALGFILFAATMVELDRRKGPGK